MTAMVHLAIDDPDEFWKERPKGILAACGRRQFNGAGGHQWVDDTVAACLRVNCPTCLPLCQQLGTPISQLSGHPGAGDRFDRFVAIAESWGHP
jgi:hypothetical protein